jgi:hypothetical protein
MRDDVQYFDEMIAAGWKPEFDNRDVKAGRTDVHDRAKCPHFRIGFVKGKTHIWKCSSPFKPNGAALNYWQVADFVDGSLINFRGSTIADDKLYRGERYENGFIPNLKEVLKLDKDNVL